MITHIVIFWTDKPHGENRDRLLAAARELLPDIPGVLEFRAGPAIASERGVVDDSFAVGLSMTFPDRATAESYQQHARHQTFVADFLRPLVRRFVVYDWES